MKKGLVGIIIWIGIAIGCVMVFSINGCKKPNDAIDNNQLIEIPYTLYFGDTAGTLYNTNDGISIKTLPFPPDGNPFRAICTSKSYLLFAKYNRTQTATTPLRYCTHLYFSSNNGTNFNESYDSLTSFPATAVNGLPYDLNQSVICDIPRWNKLYICTQNTGPTDWLGLAVSVSNGTWGEWLNEFQYNTDRVGVLLPTFSTITSMTYTSGNVLFGYDGTHNRYFYRTDTLSTTSFNETTSGLAWNPSGTKLPTTGYFTVGHYNNEIIAIDNYGTNGAYYSEDTGMNWTQFAGIPANTPLFCINSPFEEVCYVGSGGSGLFVLNTNTHAFQPCNNGLKANLIVRGIVGKENIFKNGTVQKVVYIATNKGIYKSTDNGQNWILVMNGNFTAIY